MLHFMTMCKYSVEDVIRRDGRFEIDEWKHKKISEKIRSDSQVLEFWVPGVHFEARISQLGMFHQYSIFFTLQQYTA